MIKPKYGFSGLIIGILLFLFSCNSNSNTGIANPSNDASILYAYILSNDSSPNASKAVFTVDNNDSLIYNVDSLPHGTRIDSLYVGFSFASSYGFIMNDTTTQSNYSTSATTNNAFDFTKPVTIQNLATDGKSTMKYTIKLNVHKVESYLHVWEKLNNKIANTSGENQKAILLKNKFLFYFGNGLTNTLYSSDNASQWTLESGLTGLPADAVLRNMMVFNETAYLLHAENEMYRSKDGINWTKLLVSGDANYNYIALLFTLKNRLWAVAQNKFDNNVRIATSDNGINWTFVGNKTFNGTFPVSDFTATTFRSPYSVREKAIVVGGFSPAGVRLNSIWSAEDKIISDTLNWLDLQYANSNLTEISNSAVEYYGSKLLLIGGETNSFLQDTAQMRQSINEGMNWVIPDTTINRLPLDFSARTNASIIKKSDDNTLYIIGGKSATSGLSDVWKIKVNFYSFDDYKENPYKY
ncbi:MAG: DUF6242 domain-containing protein [Paludibacteraceae bacterium]